MNTFQHPAAVSALHCRSAFCSQKRTQTGTLLSPPERCWYGRRICNVPEVAPDPGDAPCRLPEGVAVPVQPEHNTGSGDIPHRAATIGDINDPAAWCAFSCTTQSLLCSAGEIIVLQVKGEVDLGTLPILQAIARFVEGLHQANGIIAGMAWRRFTFNALGAALWVGLWVNLGDLAGDHITAIYTTAHRYELCLLIAVAVLIAAVIFRHLLHRRSRPTTPTGLRYSPR